jgi:tetratricopeptide (TPR) repeat protein
METNATQLQCPSCGAPVAITDKSCSFCSGPVLIKSFQSVKDLPMGKLNKFADFYRKGVAADPNNGEMQNSLAMCYLKLKMYGKAHEAFEKAIAANIDSSESYFYAAISVLGGKRPFLIPRPMIDKAEEYLNAAVMIEPKGVYYYLMAFIRFDYHERKHFSVRPNWEEYKLNADSAGYSEDDANSLFSILNVQKSDEF